MFRSIPFMNFNDGARFITGAMKNLPSIYFLQIQVAGVQRMERSSGRPWKALHLQSQQDGKSQKTGGPMELISIRRDGNTLRSLNLHFGVRKTIAHHVNGDRYFPY